MSFPSPDRFSSWFVVVSLCATPVAGAGEVRASGRCADPACGLGRSSGVAARTGCEPGSAVTPAAAMVRDTANAANARRRRREGEDVHALVSCISAMGWNVSSVSHSTSVRNGAGQVRSFTAVDTGIDRGVAAGH